MADGQFMAEPGKVTAAVSRPIIGQHGPYHDPMRSKPSGCATPEGDHRLSALVTQHLAVCEPRVVVNGRVDVGVAGFTRARHLPAAVDTPTTSRTDASELLDVHVDEVARVAVLIAADDPACGAVEPAESLEAQAAQHPVDRRCSHAQAVADADWPKLEAATQAFHLADYTGSCSAGHVVGTAGSVFQTSFAFRLEPAPPAVRCLPRDAHLGSHMG